MRSIEIEGTKMEGGEVALNGTALFMATVAFQATGVEVARRMAPTLAQFRREGKATFSMDRDTFQAFMSMAAAGMHLSEVQTAYLTASHVGSTDLTDEGQGLN